MTARAAEHPGVVAAFRRALLAIPVNRTFTTDELPLDAAGITGNAIGLAVKTAQDRAWIVGTGETRGSTKPSARGRRLEVWKRLAIGPQGVGQHRAEPDLLSLLGSK